MVRASGLLFPAVCYIMDKYIIYEGWFNHEKTLQESA